MQMINKFKISLLGIALTTLMLASCQRENIAPEVSAIEEGTEVIPVLVEGMPDTKMTVNATTGICAWEENDPVALYISGTGANKYVNYPVVDGSVRLSLASGQSRANYAIYPAGSAPASGYATPTVTYPSSYNMMGIAEAKYADWCPAPMVAINNPNVSTALKFYHVGALLKLTLDYVPSGTKTIVLTFTGMNVTGDFSVSNAGSATASATTTAGSTNSTVTFNNLNITGSSVTLNVPIPLGNYSSLTSISANLKDSGGSSLYSISNTVSGWGEITHGQGKKITIVTTTISGGTGLFHGYEVSKGILKWDSTLNGGVGGYTFTEGLDPLEILNYYHNESSLNVYYHTFSGVNSLYHRIMGDKTEDQSNNITNGVTVEGLLWSLPKSDNNSSYDWYIVLDGYSNANWSGKGGSTVTRPTINSSTRDKNYSYVLIDLSDATPENGAAADYHNKGLSTYDGATTVGSVGNQAGNTGYQAGVLLYPDAATIYCTALTTFGKDKFYNNILSFKTLKELTDGGCLFLPCAGYKYGSTWLEAGTHGYYWGSLAHGTANAYCVQFTSSTLTYNVDGDQQTYFPVHLVR